MFAYADGYLSKVLLAQAIPLGHIFAILLFLFEGYKVSFCNLIFLISCLRYFELVSCEFHFPTFLIARL